MLSDSHKKPAVGEKVPQRRKFLSLVGKALILPAPFLILGTRAEASIGSGFCPPRMSGGGGGSGGGESSGSVPFEDYTGAVPDPNGDPTRIALLTNRSGDVLSEPYCVDGAFVPAALERFNWVARDWRHNEPTSMDPGLLDIIWSMQKILGTRQPFNINSGYRNPASNATVGGAKQSYHMRGKATDLSTSEKPPSALQSAGLATKKGGVGIYNTFTHVDTGPVRSWGG